MAAKEPATTRGDPDTATSTPTTAAHPPEAPTDDERGLGHFRSHRQLLAEGTPEPRSTTEPPTDTKRKIRTMSIPHDIIERVNQTHSRRADIILLAADRYADHIQHIPRHNTTGRGRFCVRLNDTEHGRLLRIAKRRGWPLSPTVAALLDFYLTELETAQNKKPSRARARP